MTTPEPIHWITLASTVLAAWAGAYFSARFGMLQRERAEASRLRRRTAGELIQSLLRLRDLLRRAETSRDVGRWRFAVEAAFESIDDARHRLPAGFRHLKFSVRGAVGEAVGGVAHADFDRGSDEEDELAPFDYRWTEFAIEYIEKAVDAVRRWRDLDHRSADRLTLQSFDDWLASTGRYTPGGSSSQ